MLGHAHQATHLANVINRVLKGIEVNAMLGLKENLQSSDATFSCFKRVICHICM